MKTSTLLTSLGLLVIALPLSCSTDNGSTSGDSAGVGSTSSLTNSGGVSNQGGTLGVGAPGAGGTSAGGTPSGAGSGAPNCGASSGGVSGAASGGMSGAASGGTGNVSGSASGGSSNVAGSGMGGTSNVSGSSTGGTDGDPDPSAGTSNGGTSSGGTQTTGGTGPSDNPCEAPNLVWKSGNKTNFESYPDPGSEECVKYNGCTWAGQFAFCDDKMPESWIEGHDIAAVFPAAGLERHDICIKKGNKTMVVTVLDTCGDDDCDGCCTDNRGNADRLVDLEKYTNQRWGLTDGAIQWADLGLNANACQ